MRCEDDLLGTPAEPHAEREGALRLQRQIEREPHTLAYRLFGQSATIIGREWG